jgi:predicted CoA-binding protein
LETTKKQINDFLSNKNIALIGISRNPKNFTRSVFRELKQREYNVIPVNPYADEIEGVICYPNVESIKHKIDSALIFTSTLITLNIVEELVKKDVKNIWIYNGDDKNKLLKTLAEDLKKKNINIIQGYCPFMFLPGTQFPHRLHGFFVKLFGSYPS